MTTLPAFKAYDIRGRMPDELNPDLAFRIGRAYIGLTGAKTVVIGRDCRESSPELSAALAAGLADAGAAIRDIGLCGTEEVYFATFDGGFDGGIMITASHNPIDYNGFKLVREGARPISADSGLKEIEQAVLADKASWNGVAGPTTALEHRPGFVRHLLACIDRDRLRPLRIVSNAGNGCAGPVVEALAAELPLQFIPLHHEPDGRFPNGIPNPMLEENRAVTAAAVIEHKADLGLAWDGDFDRCFFFDETGAFIDGYYLVGLLAEILLQGSPGSAVVHDPRLIWNTEELVTAAGGRTVACRSGHAFIKATMRDEDAVYGGEMSAHHYFRDFGYCDTGTLPWLLVAQRLSESGASLGELVNQRMARFPISGETNRRVADASVAIERVAERYLPDASSSDRMDGLSVAFADWRFNLRASNTEPLLRLNVESRGDPALLKARTAELLAEIEGSGTA